MKTSAYIFTGIAILALIAGSALADDSVFKPDRASKVMGARAIDAEGQPLGTISDLVISADNQISYVIVSRMDESGYVAVPFAATMPKLNPQGDVALAVTKEDFDKAPSFASIPEWSQQDMARGYLGTSPGMDMNEVNGIQTGNPYTF